MYIAGAIAGVFVLWVLSFMWRRVSAQEAGAAAILSCCLAIVSTLGAISDNAPETIGIVVVFAALFVVSTIAMYERRRRHLFGDWHEYRKSGRCPECGYILYDRIEDKDENMDPDS